MRSSSLPAMLRITSAQRTFWPWYAFVNGRKESRADLVPRLADNPPHPGAAANDGGLYERSLLRNGRTQE